MSAMRIQFIGDHRVISISLVIIQFLVSFVNSYTAHTSRTVPFPSRLDNHYCEEEGNYGPKFTEAYGASHINNAIPRKEKDPGSFTLPCFINDFCFDNALVDLGASVSVMPLSTYLNLGLGELAHTRLTVELADRTVKYPKGIAENVLVGIGKFTFPIDFIILDMPEDVKVPLILGRPFLSTARAKIDVYKRKITLRVGEEKIIFKSVKPASSIIKRVYMLSLRERMELDLEARLMGETLVLNRSLDPFSEDYIELNYLNEPFELRRNQGDDLMPTIEEGEVIEKFRTRDENLDTGIDDCPSYCDDDKKIHIYCAHNLKFSCMIGFEFTHANFFPFLYVNMMSRKFHNSIMKNKMVYKENNVVGALMNVSIFVGTFSVMTDFAVLEDIDAYRDNEMGDIIFCEPFLREVGIKTKRFKGIITLYNGDNEVTYQMVRSHPKFKHHTNEQCNKIPPLLKVSEKDKIHGISHAYQKLKGFYKEVLNLGPDFIRVPSMEEWITSGRISVHEYFEDYYSEDQYAVSIKKIRQAAAPRAEVLADSPVSTSIDQDAPSTSIPTSQEQEHSPIISQGFEESPKTPTFHDDPLNESPNEDSTSHGSSSNVRQLHTPLEHIGRWTKDHPIANVIGDPSRLYLQGPPSPAPITATCTLSATPL
ncbi:putative reverse transcriptase domain-containing protein [Tanacetum coccineum]